jgi:CheY-like chemotaxis protein
MRVLVVDDDPDIAVYLTSLLEDHDHEVRSARDAGRAIAALASYRPDVILVDVLLPGRSGLDLLVTLRHDPERRDIPLVLVTGMDEILQHDCGSYLSNHDNVPGPDAVLGKPIDPAALLAVLRHVCGAEAPAPT